MSRPTPWLICLALLISGCSGTSATSATSTGPAAAGSSTTGSSSPAETTSTAPASPDADAQFEQQLRAKLQSPSVPSFTIPTDLLSSAQDRDTSQRLGLEPGLYQGIAVLGARCDGKGVAHSIDADAGRAVTTAGSYKKGKISVTVKGDGTGVYNAPGLHIAVLSKGSGVYEDGVKRLSVEAGGAGTFSDASKRLTVRADGSGSYTDATSRFWVGPDGAGGYSDQSVRVSVNAAGAATGKGSAEQLAAVARVVHDRLPRFAPVPAIRRVKVSGRACGTVIRLDANALFDFGSAELRPDARALVDRVGRLLTVVKPKAVQVNGYTDHIGTTSANLDLSKRRASAVRDELLGQGVPSGSMTVRGLGEQDPVARETTASGADLPSARQLNRRVEIVLPDK